MKELVYKTKENKKIETFSHNIEIYLLKSSSKTLVSIIVIIDFARGIPLKKSIAIKILRTGKETIN